MTHLGWNIAVVAGVIIGLMFRLMLLGSGAARFGFLPEKWKRWFNGPSPDQSRGK